MKKNGKNKIVITIQKFVSEKIKQLALRTLQKKQEYKGYLYNNDIIKERILSLRVIENGVRNGDGTPKDKVQAKGEKIK